METNRRAFKFEARKTAIFFILLGPALLIFYTLVFRNDWVFGIEDTFFNKRDGLKMQTIDYSSQDLNSIPLDELLHERDDIKVTNSLYLVNNKHRIDDMPVFKLESFRDTSLLLDENILNDLEDLLQAVKENTGEKVYIMSTYRTAEEQDQIYNQNPRIAAPVNASEHQIGLALDLYIYQKAQREFIDTDAGKWIHHNGWEHGFIIRYPFLKKHITGISYEPWHIRYVGKPHAEIIYQNGWTLEEYISFLDENLFYTLNGFVISRQKPRNGRLNIPKNIDSISLSPDNTGFYIVTGKIQSGSDSFSLNKKTCLVCIIPNRSSMYAWLPRLDSNQQPLG